MTSWHKIVALVTVCVLLLFGDLLIDPTELILSKRGTDLYNTWFGFVFFKSELLKGHIPLWNPHLFSGNPYFAALQTGVFYPPNWIFLVLPTARAINAFIVFHLLLSGGLMYCWARRRGLGIEASLLTAFVFALGAPTFLKTYAGHHTPLAAASWIPLIFLCIDELRRKLTLRTFLILSGALALQVFSGYLQHVFFTAIAVGIYLLLHAACEIRDAQYFSRSLRVWLTIGGGYAFAIALTFVQLYISANMSDETIRGGGTPFGYAASFSFPPENILTLLFPFLFGDGLRFEYWGRCYLWEMCLFPGLAALSLAFYSFRKTPPHRREIAILGVAVLALWFLALGSHTPLFRFLFDHVPGFDKFRSQSKFITQAGVFIAMLSGYGVQRWLAGTTSGEAPAPAKQATRWLLPCAVVSGVLLLQGSWLVATAGHSVAWEWLESLVERSGESYFRGHDMTRAQFLTQSQRFGGEMVLAAAATMALMTGVMSQAWRGRPWRRAVVAFALLELMVFARVARTEFDINETRQPAIEKFLQEHPGDYRYLKNVFGNAAMADDTQDIWGYESFRLRRYAEFMAALENKDVDAATGDTEFRTLHPLLKMLRCRYLLSVDQGSLTTTELADPMPLLNLVPNWRIIPDQDRKRRRDQILAHMLGANFDPSREVVLEQVVPIEPPKSNMAGLSGTVRLVSRTTDSLEIEADLAVPQMLLITDSYSKGWRAEALNGSSQSQYDLLPADWTLRAVPLQAGHHHLRVLYDPPAWHVGKRVSGLALILYLGLWGCVIKARRTRGTKGKVADTA